MPLPYIGPAPASATDVDTKGYVDTASGLLIPLTQKAAANGVATLDATTLIPQAQLAPARILAQLLTVDGAASGLDADLLDGKNSTAFCLTDSAGATIKRGSAATGAFAGTPATASGTITFPTAFTVVPTVILCCSALTGNTTTVVNLTAVSITNFTYRAALVSGTSTSTVTIYWIAIGTA
jgi:hypothetical protein